MDLKEVKVLPILRNKKNQLILLILLIRLLQKLLVIYQNLLDALPLNMYNPQRSLDLYQKGGYHFQDMLSWVVIVSQSFLIPLVHKFLLHCGDSIQQGGTVINQIRNK